MLVFVHQLIQRIGHWPQIIVLLGPRDFSKKLAGQVSLNNDEGLYEEFNLLNPSQKSLVLLDSEITQDLAEELLMREKDPTIFLTSKVIEKLAKNCDEECQQKKSETLQEIDIARVKSDQYYKKEEETINSHIAFLKKASKFMSVISNATGKYRAKFEPDQIKQELNQKINIAHNPCFPKKKSSCGEKGFLTQKQFETMTKSVKDAKDLDEVKKTSEEMKNSMNKERKKYEKKNNIIKDQKGEINSYWDKVKTGVKSMATLENLQKATQATSTIIGAIGNTRDKHHTLIYKVEISVKLN